MEIDKVPNVVNEPPPDIEERKGARSEESRVKGKKVTRDERKSQYQYLQ